MQESHFTPSGPPKTASTIQKVIAAAFPGLVLAQIALSLYHTNRGLLSTAEIPWHYGLAVVFLGWLLTIAALHRGGLFGRVTWSLFAGHVLFLLLRDICFPAQFSALDGTDPLAGVSSIYRKLGMLAWGGSILLVLLLPWRASITGGFLLSLVFGASVTVQTFSLTPSDTSDEVIKPFSADVPTTGKSAVRPDIYHIMYDTYQTVEHEYTAKTNGSAAPYEDFIFYPNNLATYNWTELVIPSIFSGSFYSPDRDISEWKDSYQSTGLLKKLKDAGYTINGHSFQKHYFSSPLCDVERHTADIIEEVGRKNGSSIGNFCKSPYARMLILRCLPTTFSRKIISRLDRSSSQSGEVPATATAYYCALKFREVLQEIETRPEGGNYYFVHLILPHLPFVLDRNGKYLGHHNGTHYEQSLFADKLSAELVDTLKRLKRYDSSMIIIQADTGEYFVPDVKQQSIKDGELKCYISENFTYHNKDDPNQLSTNSTSHWPISIRHDATLCPPDIVRARSQALLLIKPPHHQGRRVEPRLTQSTDIAPTMLALADIPYSPSEFPDGVDLFGSPTPGRIGQTFVIGLQFNKRRTGGLQQWRVTKGELIKGDAWKIRDDLDLYQLR